MGIAAHSNAINLTASEHTIHTSNLRQQGASEVHSTDCSFGEPRFDFQHPSDDSKLSLDLVLEAPVLLSNFLGVLGTHGAQTKDVHIPIC